MRASHIPRGAEGAIKLDGEFARRCVELRRSHRIPLIAQNACLITDNPALGGFVHRPARRHARTGTAPALAFPIAAMLEDLARHADRTMRHAPGRHRPMSGCNGQTRGSRAAVPRLGSSEAEGLRGHPAPLCGGEDQRAAVPLTRPARNHAELCRGAARLLPPCYPDTIAPARGPKISP
jgi:hypothetical protein